MARRWLLLPGDSTGADPSVSTTAQPSPLLPPAPSDGAASRAKSRPFREGPKCRHQGQPGAEKCKGLSAFQGQVPSHPVGKQRKLCAFPDPGFVCCLLWPSLFSREKNGRKGGREDNERPKRLSSFASQFSGAQPTPGNGNARLLNRAGSISRPASSCQRPFDTWCGWEPVSGRPQPGKGPPWPPPMPHAPPHP